MPTFGKGVVTSLHIAGSEYFPVWSDVIVRHYKIILLVMNNKKLGGTNVVAERMPDESPTDKSPRAYIFFILLLTLYSKIKKYQFLNQVLPFIQFF